MTNLNDLLPADLATIDATFAYCRTAASELIARTTIELLNDDPHADLAHMTIARSISADQLESASFATINDNPDIDPELLFCLISLILCDRLNCADSDLCADY